MSSSKKKEPVKKPDLKIVKEKDIVKETIDSKENMPIEKQIENISDHISELYNRNIRSGIAICVLYDMLPDKQKEIFKKKADALKNQIEKEL